MPDLPPQIGVLVELDKAERRGRQGRRAAHRRLRAEVPHREDIPAEAVENERRVAEETAREEGKPEAALPKIVEGRVNGFFKEHACSSQPFAKDNKKSVQKVLDEAGVTAEALRALPRRHLSPFRDRPAGRFCTLSGRRQSRAYAVTARPVVGYDSRCDEEAIAAEGTARIRRQWPL